MIQRNDRDAAASLVRRFRDGEITNDMLEDAWPDQLDDRALKAVRTMVWRFHSDMYEHALTGKHALTPEAHEMLTRCAIFLDTDIPYEWPHDRLDWTVPLRIDPWARRREAKKIADMEAAGDVEVWPFMRRDSWNVAVQQHRTVKDEPAGNVLPPGTVPREPWGDFVLRLLPRLFLLALMCAVAVLTYKT